MYREIEQPYEPEPLDSGDAATLHGAADNAAEERAEREAEREQAAYERAHGDAPILDRSGTAQGFSYPLADAYPRVVAEAHSPAECWTCGGIDGHARGCPDGEELRTARITGTPLSQTITEDGRTVVALYAAGTTSPRIPACPTCVAEGERLGDPTLGPATWEQEYERTERVRVSVESVTIHQRGADLVERGWPSDAVPVAGSEQYIAASVPARHVPGRPLMRWRPVLRCDTCGDVYRIDVDTLTPSIRLDRLTDAQVSAMDFDRYTPPTLTD